MPLYTPRKPPDWMKPCCDCKRVLIVSMGKKSRSTDRPATAPPCVQDETIFRSALRARSEGVGGADARLEPEGTSEDASSPQGLQIRTPCSRGPTEQ